jgi:HK97 family phage prohead protease
MTLSNRAERLKGTVERRNIGLTDFDMRQEGDTLQFSGYASLFNVGYEMYGGPDKGGWIENVDKGAFTRTLSTKPDVVLNINHGEGGTGLPIARTSSGTLQLRTDTKGLRPEASLDLRDPDVQALQVKVERGDVNQMSFAFRTIRQEWDEEETQRTLMEVSLDRGDVSIVTNGAQPKTSVQLRSLIAQLATMDPEEAREELRALDAVEMPMVQSACALLDSLLDMNGATFSDPDEDGTLSASDDTQEQREDGLIVPKKGISLARARHLAMLDS